MKKPVKNLHSLIVAIVMTLLGLVCLGVYWLKDRDARLLAAAFVVFVWAVGDFYDAFHRKPIEERISGMADERDRYLAMKSSRTAMSIFNKTLLLGSVVCFWVYARCKVEFLLPVAVTLCGVELLLFLLLLCVNLYYEKQS
ncbi:MAG: DUF2178 domain-containing protein [Acutalibacter sp.]